MITWRYTSEAIQDTRNQYGIDLVIFVKNHLESMNCPVSKTMMDPNTFEIVMEFESDEDYGIKVVVDSQVPDNLVETTLSISIKRI